MNPEIEKYKAYLSARLNKLSPILQKYALGDFSEEIPIPEEEDEFTELFVGIKLMADDLQEILRERERSVSNLEQAEKDLREAKDFVDKIMESLEISIWIADEEGTAIRANPACLDFFGATEAEVIGKYNLFKDGIIQESGYMPEVRRAFEKGESVSFEMDYDFSTVDHVDVKNATHKITRSIFTPIIDA